MSDYTPTTDEVRATYGIGWFADDDTPPGDPSNFDRWLAERDAERWDAGAKAMMNAIGDTYGTLAFIAPENPHRVKREGLA